jgi:hypothetical protein
MRAMCAHTSIGAMGSSRRRFGARQVECGESRISIDRVFDLEDDLGGARAGEPVGLGGRHTGNRGERTISSAAGCWLRSETAARDRVGHAEAAAETRRHTHSIVRTPTVGPALDPPTGRGTAGLQSGEGDNGRQQSDS